MMNMFKLAICQFHEWKQSSKLKLLGNFSSRFCEVLQVLFLNYGIVVVHSFFTASSQLGEQSGVVVAYGSSVAQHLIHFWVSRNCALSLCKVVWKLSSVGEKQKCLVLLTGAAGRGVPCCRLQLSCTGNSAASTLQRQQRGKKKSSRVKQVEKVGIEIPEGW